MGSRKYRFIFVLTFILMFSLSINAVSANTTQPKSANPPQLQTGDWHIVMYEPTADVLYWLNENGQEASVARPLLPNEAAPFSPRLLMSPDGRILIIAAPLTNGQEGLGFYNLQTKQFIQTHTAQSGESIILGNRYSINATSSAMAVGFVTPPTANSPNFSWRVLQFDLSTGFVLDELRSDGQEINNFVGGDFFTTSLYAPNVVWYFSSEVTGETEIHIQFEAWGEPPFVMPTLAWYPQGVPGVGQELVTSPYTIAGIDFDIVSGDAIFVHEDPNFPNLGGTGLYRNYNSVARGVPDGIGNFPDPVVLHSDGNSFFHAARWGANGSMALMQIGNQQQPEQWYYMRMGGGPVLVGSNTVDVIGLPMGFAWLTDTGVVGVHSADGVLHNEKLWQSPTQFPRFLWASVGVVPFGLTGLVNSGGNSGNGGNNGIGGVVTNIAHCAGAPLRQVKVGDAARVTFTDGRALNMRSTPNGTVVTQLSEGTAFTIMGGPQCGGDFTWWQIQLATGASGWVAEGDANNYYIEPTGNNGVGAQGGNG